MNIQHLAFLQNLSAPELIIIFLIVLLLFGAKRLPGLFKSLGQSVKEFKKATSGIEEDIRTAMDTEDEPTPKAPRAESKKASPTTPVAEAPKSEVTESKKEDA
ncbi:MULTISPECIES: twin-arginine translocase TatA/TatE family subunit [unclassified Lentimonas]|uniref:Sec-independent protein translocase subunit TatA/TatB n=1 Tax=unclassified Lentimonas TaxID=2630993 RepID=UPI00132B7C5E|nr:MULTISPECIES: twin-arginine translocase TatA/TatE family subunit [unclassified Lentimonas]CAA6677060.1 Twin-arginine translocation protein TatA [Lentimonas sp. CC4]CAA6687254.1 Twin-arginine translocation protein TatA [Lentimonas sp. CC6]CAA6692331.1 Twin-arginine translocation protein TatA [Lentimonas sp. CC10]CAA6694665.1 Twin-arginine translocation protein TatA [Lentimonas sp. CC19]CAA7071414.1 Twin-arginine translocation protein TatA [Lentimonas sp. CC11]